MRFSHLLIFLLVCFSCAQTTSPQQQEASSEPVSLIGTWDLVSFIAPDDPDKLWRDHGDTILYQKHLTPTHFTWIMYDLKNDQMIGMGGGNYSRKENLYIENIDFFHPPASSELGQSIPFEVRFEDGKWYHTGYAKEVEMDFDLGTVVVADSTKIEEIWKRTQEPIAANDQLVGTWDLQQYRYDANESYYEYPKMMGYLKLITPTHFIWVKYDKEGDQIFGSGSGPYRFDGNRDYQEVIQMMHPPAHTLRGTTVQFDIDVSDHRWDLLGYGLQQPNNDTLLIDEVWGHHANTLEEEVAINF